MAETVRELGINANLLGRWKRQLAEDGEEAFLGKGRLKPLGEEVRGLHGEVKWTREGWL